MVHRGRHTNDCTFYVVDLQASVGCCIDGQGAEGSCAVTTVHSKQGGWFCVAFVLALICSPSMCL